MAEQILVVEDDAHIAKLLRYNLEKNGYQCRMALTGEEALTALDGEPVDLILLDVMLPKIDGFETCRRIRQERRFAHIPVIFLSARGEEMDRVVGLELGADDYVVKPFSPRELLLRVKRALARRQTVSAEEKEILLSGPLTVDIPRHRVQVKGREVVLTSMEFKLLVTLIRRRGRVQSREQLLNDVWDIDADVTTRTVDTHVKCLRQKLGEAGSLIETVWGHGYRLNDEEDTCA